MALKDIKAKIGATERTHKVTRAMEAVSAVKMRKTQEAALLGRAYARAALSILARLSQSSELARHPLMQKRAAKNIALVILTSDKGLAGALNSSVLKIAFDAVQTFAPQQVRVYAIGKKGAGFFARRGYALALAEENKKDDIPLSVTDELAKALTNGFVDGTFDEVLVAYSNFRSTFEQVPTVRPLLPLTVDGVRALVGDIVPHKGHFSDLALPETAPVYTVEPNADEVLNVLLPKLVGTSLYHQLLESKASEHSARMVAMKSASDKSKEVARALKRQFNKARQAAITREVSEIVSGREALTA
jgi:F-type H+-transporting ATPase subunit gamma